MKIEIDKIVNSSLKSEFDVSYKENHKIYAFVLYEYHDEYTESNKWFLAFIGIYNKFTKPQDRPTITYFGGKIGCEYEEETTYENYNETLTKMMETIKSAEF